MEQREGIDLRRWDAVWQRVAPDLNPYPEVRAARTQERQADAPAPEALAAAAEEELTARRAYLAHGRCAGGATGRALALLASESARCACRLRSLYFLLTDGCYQPIPVCGQTEILTLCRFLRLRYQMAVESAERFDGWANGVADVCMAAALRAMADDKRRQAATLLGLLENCLG